MAVGIGLPNAVQGVERRGIVDWARRAEEAGFSSLGTIDRVVYPSYESLVSLAAAAAVTERIGLVTDILIAPLRRSTALLAKQGADERQAPTIGTVELLLAVMRVYGGAFDRALYARGTDCAELIECLGDRPHASRAG